VSREGELVRGERRNIEMDRAGILRKLGIKEW
jgi:hypothetical protein